MTGEPCLMHAVVQGLRCRSRDRPPSSAASAVRAQRDATCHSPQGGRAWGQSPQSSYSFLKTPHSREEQNRSQHLCAHPSQHPGHGPKSLGAWRNRKTRPMFERRANSAEHPAVTQVSRPERHSHYGLNQTPRSPDTQNLKTPLYLR